MLRPKKLALFPEIERVKTFSSFTHPHSPMCIRIYIFDFKKPKPKKKQEYKKI